MNNTNLVLLAFGVLCLCAYHGEGNSSGLNVPSCDIFGTKWGCERFRDAKSLVRNVPGDCVGGEGEMFWASVPVWSDKYELRLGDGMSANFPKTYKPGKLHDLWVKVLDLKYKFRGLLMKAVLVGQGNKTAGSWVYPTNEDSALYWSPPSCSDAVFHTSAVVKPLSTLVRWRAPPAGSGDVVFQVLIKQGPANRGAFYRSSLRLTEGSAGTQQWFKGAKGQSCDQVCSSKGLSCQAAKMKAANDEAKLVAAVSSEVVCDRPVFSGCSGSTGPKLPGDLAPIVTPTDVCYHHDNSCSNRVDCGSFSRDASKLCACGRNRRLLSPPDDAVQAVAAAAGGATSGGVARAPHGALQLVLAVGSVLLLRPSRGSSSLLLMALLCLCLTTQRASAHNWYRSESRSSKSATSVRPCKKRIGERFHVQVGPAQEFSVAWATGHGSTVTAAIVAAKDLDKVKNKQEYLAAIKDYIASAPSSANLLNNKKWHRTHGMPADPGAAAPAPFVRQIPKTDPLWHMSTILQEERFGSRSNQVFEFKPSELANDKRVEYKSGKYPWIVSALQMPITKVNFGQFDQVLVRIPAGYPTGHYVVAWDWQGYNDCVDVEVRSQPVQFVNGQGSTDFIFKRVEHCAYNNPKRLISGCPKPVASMAECENVLRSWPDTQRVGFTVAPALAPPLVAPFLRDGVKNTHVPWNTPECGTSDVLQLNNNSAFSVKMTRSDTGWQARWTQKDTKTSTSCNGNPLFTKATLRDAVVACGGSDRCQGIAVSTAAPTAFLGCGSTKAAGAEWTAYTKKTAGVTFGQLSNAPASSFTKEFSVSFHAPGTNVGLSGGMVADTGAVYGNRNGRSYGWKCPHTLFGKVNNQNGADQTYAESFWKPCGGTACNAPGSGWSGPELPAGCTRNNWEVAVPNGWYRVDARAFALRGCGFENVSPTETQRGAAGGMGVTRTYTRVQDGKFTISDNGWRGCCARSTCHKLATLTLYRLTNGALTPPAVWTPTETAPWWQVELKKSQPIGLVSIMNRPGNCAYNWLYSNVNSCVDKDKQRAMGYFTGTGGVPAAAVVGVSDTPCSGQNCGGTVCGRVERTLTGQGLQVGLDHAVTSVEHLKYRHYVNCSGATGKYVWIQLPGGNRIMPFNDNDVQVFRATPVSTGADYTGKFECHKYDNGGKNDWHWGTLAATGADTFKWTNRAGRSWTYTKTSDPTTLSVGTDCPYYNGGYKTAKVTLRNNKAIAMQVVDCNYDREGDVPGALVNTAANPYVCIGYVAVDNPDEANPEVVTSDDPEDPTFYSTCLVRERNLVFLPPEGSNDATLASNEPYTFNGKCLDCGAYSTSLKPTAMPLTWDFTNSCKACRGGAQLSSATNTIFVLGLSGAPLVAAGVGVFVGLILAVAIVVFVVRRRGGSGPAGASKWNFQPTASNDGVEMQNNQH